MTLTEVANMIYAADGDLAVYVFDDDDERDQYRNSTAPDGYCWRGVQKEDSHEQ